MKREHIALHGAAQSQHESTQHTTPQHKQHNTNSIAQRSAAHLKVAAAPVHAAELVPRPDLHPPRLHRLQHAPRQRVPAQRAPDDGLLQHVAVVHRGHCSRRRRQAQENGGGGSEGGWSAGRREVQSEERRLRQVGCVTAGEARGGEREEKGGRENKGGGWRCAARAAGAVVGAAAVRIPGAGGRPGNGPPVVRARAVHCRWLSRGTFTKRRSASDSPAGRTPREGRRRGSTAGLYLQGIKGAPRCPHSLLTRSDTP